MWIEREAQRVLLKTARQFPAVLLSGPRRCGKTALLRRLFPQASYVSLDRPSDAEAARTRPGAFLGGFPEPLVLDEVQYAPSLFRELKARIDAAPARRCGRFLLTGSQSFELMQGVSESLAGRCALLNLQTLSWSEARAARPRLKSEEFLFQGGFPELHSVGGLEREIWYPAYVATYLERDVRNIVQVSNLGDFDRFLRAAALRTAALLSYADLARDVGVAPNTARKWLSVLAASSTVILLEAYHRNLGKRLAKAPKAVFADSGLACFLMGFRSAADALASPVAGAIWEGHVIGQIWRRFAFRGLKPPLWYWRTQSGQEVDAVLEEGGGRLTAIECKLSEHPTSRDCAGIRALRQFYGRGAIKRAWIVCRTPRRYEVEEGVEVVGLEHLDEL